MYRISKLHKLSILGCSTIGRKNSLMSLLVQFVMNNCRQGPHLMRIYALLNGKGFQIGELRYFAVKPATKVIIGHVITIIYDMETKVVHFADKTQCQWLLNDV